MTNDIINATIDLLRAQGLTPEHIAQLLDEPGGAAESAPTLREFAEKVLNSLKESTAKDYRPHITRLLNGEPRQCSCICTECVDEWVYTGTCHCECSTCRTAISFKGLGDRVLRPRSIVASDLIALPIVAQRIAEKRAVFQNRSRASRGLSSKPTTGQGGQEMCVSAVRCIFGRAFEDELLTRNPALKLDKGSRSEPRRWHLTDDHLVELFETVVSGGDDPELDLFTTWTELELGARRGGLLSMQIGRLLPLKQAIELHEKNNKVRLQPCSAELINALMTFAASRGGKRCIPGEPEYDPSAPVFYYKDSTPENPHPLTARRFDTLHRRIQKALPWANEVQYTGHALRHTIGTFVERVAGVQVAKAMLGHGPKKPTDDYTKGSYEEVAAAISLFTGRPNPASDS